MGRKSAVAEDEEEEEPLPDHLRCGRTDGRQWRCRRRVKDNLKLCEIHYLQGRHRQFKEKVPESLKLQRNQKNKNNDHTVLSNAETRARKASKMAKLTKRKRKLSEDSEELAVATPARKKKKGSKQGGDGDMQLELIRMVLKREVEKRKNKKKDNNKKNNKKVEEEEEEELHCSERELRRELPNGVMAISPASTPNDYSNVGYHCEVKVGADCKTVTPRYFRSKNVDRVPVGKLQAVPYGPDLKKGKVKRKTCHWCQRNDARNLIKCSSCQKEFFCMNCVKKWYFVTQNEVKKACPVCRGTCTCKDCFASQCTDSESKEYLSGKSQVDRILHFHYLICMLLPVLKQISEEQDTMLQAEAENKGKTISDIHIKRVELGSNEKIYCNHCKTPVFDLHRCCPSCSYRLCSSCCQELRQGITSGETNSSIVKLPDKMDACIASKSNTLDDQAISIGNSIRTSRLSEWTDSNVIDSVSCPSTELGGCGNSHLDLRCVFPSSWIKEMEVKAEEIVCSYDFPETSDKSSRCSLCFDADHRANSYKQLQEAALREDSNDNCLFYPTVSDISGDNFEHFQIHWGKGYPVVVQDVLQHTSNLSWDPLNMFCTYLERSITRYENNKDLLESCLDWCEVEINIMQYFTGSLICHPQKNTWHEMLKLKGWLSSRLFKEQFPAHFAEVIDCLPVQEYMNPMSGLFNIAANLPHGSSKHDIGPYVYISYGCAGKGADSLTKLCYDSYDMVNIMAHTIDVPLTAEQLSKIRKLLKKHKALCESESSKIATEQLQEHNAEEMEQNGLQNIVKEGIDFFRRVNRTSCISTEAKKATGQSADNKISLDGECDSFYDSDSDSESSLHHNGNVRISELSMHKNPRNPLERSDIDKNKSSKHSCAQWDVFRRQDVPKLMEYLKRHSGEFSYIHDYQKKMVHPILDQNIFLDRTHKRRLKEEFEVEPWTFQQHVGEAVIIPAGCPYQIRNPKCCVHVVVEFVSPENITECIQLIDEVGLLPGGDHKAKVDKLELKKMALHSVSTAIKEIHELTHTKHDCSG